MSVRSCFDLGTRQATPGPSFIHRSYSGWNADTSKLGTSAVNRGEVTSSHGPIMGTNQRWTQSSYGDETNGAESQPTLHKLTNPSEEAKGFEGHLSVSLKLYRHCQLGISFKTTKSDLNDTLELCLISVCYMCLDKEDVTFQPCVT